MKKILITGSHATPAFAVLDELLKQNTDSEKKLEFIWVGEKYNQRGTKIPSAEYNIVTTKYSLKFINIKAGKLFRKWNSETWLIGLKEFLNLFIGFIQSFFIILNEKPDLVLSFGGFLAVPVVFWGKLFGKKVITHEQTITTGLANKIIARFADKILISFEESGKYYPRSKVIFTGNPLRKEVFKVDSDNIRFNNSKLPILYITGGNQGAHEINRRVFEVLDQLLENFNIIHQTGNSSITGDYEKALQLKEWKMQNNLKNESSDKNNVKKTNGEYLVFDYIGPDIIGEVLNKADLILTRSGANTVLEIMALGKLAIMIPIPWASNDEQTKNANLVATTGLGKVLKQTANLTSQELLDALLEGLDHYNSETGFNNEAIQNCRKNAKVKVKLDAAPKVAELVLNTLNN